MDKRNIKTDGEQNAQARLVLIQLQWLVTILLISALLWLGNNQAKLIEDVNGRLQATEHLSDRLNQLDDRLFSVQTLPKQSLPRNVDNDWQLLFVQMGVVARLYEQGEYLAVGELLKGVRFQLDDNHLNVATPLKNSLRQAIDDDLVVLDSLQNQPDAWQLHIIRLQEIQHFLRTQMSSDNELNRNELVLQNTQMLLTMAIGASSLREKQTMNHYLLESKSQLEWLKKHSTFNKAVAKTNTELQKEQALALLPANRRIESLEEAIFVINELLANPPIIPPLISTQILKR